MTSIKLTSSVSVPNVDTFICLIDNVMMAEPSGHSVYQKHEEAGTSKEDDKDAIQVQRSAAFHELIESNRKLVCLDNFKDISEDRRSRTILPPQQAETSSRDKTSYENPKILNLTKTRWLSESRDGSPDARQALLTPCSSTTSTMSDDVKEKEAKNADRVLSTVLALDKEHNLFGLSHIKIGDSKEWKQIDKRSKGVFRQNSIVLVCYKECCNHKSKSDLPTSLKCGGCRSFCSWSKCGSCTSVCSSCISACSPCPPIMKPCRPPCPRPCGSPCRRSCSPRSTSCGPRPCSPRPLPSCGPIGGCNAKPCLKAPKACPVIGCTYSPCENDCTRFGLEMTVMKKHVYPPVYKEIEPKSSCVLNKPVTARVCHHVPHCMPPSSCFPYLMPCYWPARPGVPCSEPARCFHNPPCVRRQPRASKPGPQVSCPTGQPCAGTQKNPSKCENLMCIGRDNEKLKKALKDKFEASPKTNPQQPSK